MKNEAFRYLVSCAAFLLVLLSLSPACTQLPAAPATTPSKPQTTKPAAPPATSENQSAEAAETPPVTPPSDEGTWYPVATFSGIVNETTPVFHIYGTEWHLNWTIEAEDPETAVFKLTIHPKEQPFIIWQTVSNDGGNSGTLDYFMSNVDKRDLFIKVTALNLQQWTIKIEDNAIAATSYPVEISSIHYKGTVFEPNPDEGFCYERVEPDEYVVIKNLSSCYIDLTDWKLKNISKPSPTFKFPPAVIMPGGIIRIYTDEYHPETGGLTFYYGFGDIWSNDHNDIAVLYDALGNEVSRKSYTVSMPLNQAAE